MICPPSAPGTIQGPQSYPTETLIQHYADRARNGAAIVTCSGHYLTPPDRSGHMWGWDVRQGLTQNMMSEMAEAIHLHGSLANGFLISFPEPGYDVSGFDPAKNQEVRFMLSEPFVEMPREMIYETIDRYISQVKALRECGFDGVNIHMCYRFTLAARFLSPMTNVRTDEFGGSLQNRMRFAKLLCGGIKNACGKNFIIEVTISGHDPVENGWTLQDSIAFSREMKGLVDIMTVRASTLDPQHPTGYTEEKRPWVYMAEEIKKGGPEILIAASSGLEKTDKLGGLLKHTDYVSFKWPLRDYKDYLIRKVYENSNITVHLSTEISPETLNAEGFEAVLAAVGSEPVRLPIPGIDRENVHFAVDVLGKEEGLGETIVLIGGGEIGVETGIYLARRGHKVTVLEMTDALAREAIRGHYYSMIQDAWEAEENFSFILNATCTAITEEGVEYRDAEGSVHVVPADNILLSAGMRAKTSEALRYGVAGQYFRAIGDCQKAASVQQAVRSAYTAALAL